MYTRSMIGLITLSVLLLSCSADPGSPKIYNVLISSKKNLSPSHAQPIYEPVLRTTSLGYVFPSLIYHTSFIQGLPATYIAPDYTVYRRVDIPQNIPQPVSISTQEINKDIENQPQPNQSNQETLAEGQFIPQSNPYAVNYIKYLPKEEQDGQNVFSTSQEEADPKKVIANLKKNSDIPDVPPPPLPVRVTDKQ